MEIITNIKENIHNIIAYMSAGNPIIVPTDTNYNFICFPKSRKAIDKIFEYKKRPKNKPLSLFFLNPNDWKKYGIAKNEQIMNVLVKNFCPGAINLVIDKKTSDYDYMLNGMDTIAVGSVYNSTWREFMSYLNGEPVAITSANISGTVDKGLVTKEMAIKQFSHCVRYLIESKDKILMTKSSSIVLIKKDSVEFLREGDINEKMINTIINIKYK